MINRNEKGKRAERELARLLTAMGLPSRRGQQYSGIEGKDVVGPPGVHIECKWQETTRLREWIEQAVSDAQGGDVPVVCHRKSLQPWLVTFRLDDLPGLVERLYLELCSEGGEDHEVD